MNEILILPDDENFKLEDAKTFTWNFDTSTFRFQLPEIKNTEAFTVACFMASGIWTTDMSRVSFHLEDGVQLNPEWDAASTQTALWHLLGTNELDKTLVTFVKKEK